MSSELPPTRRGYDVREVVSAFQKAVRRGDVDAVLYWSLEMVRSGFGAWWWKRVRIVAVEDCSPAAIGLVSDLRALHEWWQHDSKVGGERNLYVAAAAVKVAIAPKNQAAVWGLMHHASHHVERREIPDHAVDRHTRRGRQMGRDWDHFLEHGRVLEQWVGSLEELEAEYLDRFHRQIERHPDLPVNRWESAKDETDEPPRFAQLKIESDREEER